MRTALLLAALIFAVPAYAQASLGSAPRRALLSDSEGHASVASDAKGSMFLIGLGLTGAGLLLGGAGFAVLYACREGTECHSDKTLQTAGWVLAAPGVIPLAIGLFMLYAAVGGKSSGVALGVMPLPDGGLVASGAFRF